jgi:hypothetical protein
MKTSKSKKILIVFIHALIIWVFCGVTIAAGRSVMSMNSTLVVHAIAAPVFAALVSMIYFKRFNYSSPALTALYFLFIIITMDAGLVAPVFEGSYIMFRSIPGTWIPFSLIFLATFATGTYLKRNSSETKTG